MAKGTIHVSAEVIIADLLRLNSEYALQDVSVEQRPSGGIDIVFVVKMQELPGREDMDAHLLPIYENMADEHGTRWYRLKEVQVV